MSAHKFFRLLADATDTKRWYLKSPLDHAGNEVDPRIFTKGVPVAVRSPLKLPLRRDGKVVDFNFADFDMVVTPAVINAELEKIDRSAIQRIAVTIDTSRDEYEILNVCQLVSCVDVSRSVYMKWCEADGRPEKIGEFRMIANLKIDSATACGHDIFRIAEWPVALIVSEKVKELFEARQLTGLAYECVN